MTLFQCDPTRLAAGAPNISAAAWFTYRIRPSLSSRVMPSVTLCRMLSVKDEKNITATYSDKYPNHGRILIKYDNDQFAHWRERSIKNALKFFYGKRGFQTMSEGSKITEDLVGLCFAKGKEKYETSIQLHKIENPNRPLESTIGFAITVSS